ncbi:MAG: 50S ribosomal protein L11 methyltransferase [Magnetococcales bacterium]|nr:50S ribosomal protein L11 methyltransferase [Magnetococcales bacterium]
MTWELGVQVGSALEEIASEHLVTEGSMGVSLSVTGGETLLVTGYFDDAVDRNGVEIRLMLRLSAHGWEGGAGAIVWKPVAEQDWAEAWKEHYRPVSVGERLWIVPTWLEAPVGDGRMVLRMDPEMAFGSGAHATTRGCLELLERCAGEAPLGRVLDLGTGSGVLAIWAAMLGADEVVATDLDPVAVETAGRNARLNGVGERLVLLESATVPPGSFATVVANILAGVLLDLAPLLTKALSSGGRLMLSGILREQAREVQLAFEGEGLRLEQTLFLEEWAVLSLVHPGRRGS